MKRIGVMSDTHNWWDEKYARHFADCDEIWHAGDIGSSLIIDRLETICPVRAVYGNIDGQELRLKFNEILRFKIEECSVIIKHIGGYPGKYDPSIKNVIYKEKPDIFIAGHSHIVKIKYDHLIDCLHINPGAAGKQGWQQVRTLIKFTVNGKDVKDLEIIELAD